MGNDRRIELDPGEESGGGGGAGVFRVRGTKVPESAKCAQLSGGRRGVVEFGGLATFCSPRGGASEVLVGWLLSLLSAFSPQFAFCFW